MPICYMYILFTTYKPVSRLIFFDIMLQDELGNKGLSNEEKRRWSVTRIDDKCLAYKIHKPWKDIGNNIKDRFRCETSYVREISFAQMIHSVNSFKNTKICTLNFGNCSTDMMKKLYLWI